VSLASYREDVVAGLQVRWALCDCGEPGCTNRWLLAAEPDRDRWDLLGVADDDTPLSWVEADLEDEGTRASVVASIVLFGVPWCWVSGRVICEQARACSEPPSWLDRVTIGQVRQLREYLVPTSPLGEVTHAMRALSLCRDYARCTQ
jgi:hypothetical protein